jgi:hypothetical protein
LQPTWSAFFSTLLGERSKGLFELIKLEHPDKVIIDMRLNGGGDYKEGL